MALYDNGNFRRNYRHGVFIRFMVRGMSASPQGGYNVCVPGLSGDQASVGAKYSPTDLRA